MATIGMAPPPYFGSGPIEGRYARRDPYFAQPIVKHPWYYDQTKSTAAMLLTVFGLLLLGHFL